jgi:AcrR family transcriptional regulator
MGSRRKIALTRAALYRLVWTSPLSAVAEEVGLSSKAVAKICSRLLVPYPARGYWAKVKAGRKPARAPLPPAPEQMARHVTISSAPSVSRRARTRLAPAVRREQLFEVARAIILQEGPHAASMKHIAAAAGISETHAYNCFASREALLIELGRSELAKLQAVRQASIERAPKGHYAKVTAATLAYLRQIDHRGGLLQMLLSNPTVRAALREDDRKRGLAAGPAHAQTLIDRFGLPRGVAVGSTVVLSRLCMRVGKLIAEKRLSLQSAERFCLAVVLNGSRRIVARHGQATVRRAQRLKAA